MATIKNATNRYDIKDYMANVIAPKYFDNIKNKNDLNIGLFGYVTDVMSDIANDTMFTVSSLYKEIFPQLAELPESIYNHALIYQLNNVFANPSQVAFTILVAEDNILDNGTIGNNYQTFDIDSSMEFNIDNITFMLDYDIRIISKKTNTGWSHQAQYVIDRENSISDLKNPYIKSSIFTNDNGKRYLMMGVILHQVKKKIINDTILSNDQINAVTLSYSFSDQLANFEVFYKPPGANSYVQLKKNLANSAKLNTPFCFYKLFDDNTLEISFTTDDNYFQPEYNSEVIIELYTTLGEDGNFDSYDGNDVEVIGKFDKYPSNRGIIFMGTVVGSATNGANRKTLETLQNDTIKAYSTIKAFNTTNDLNLYFNEVATNCKYNSEILFMRKRDDVFARMYSAFVLFRDSDNNVVPTNTLDLIIKPSDVDYSLQQSGRYVIGAGKLFEYNHDSDDDPCAETNGMKYSDDLDPYEDTTRFIYINPFLTVVNTSPLGVSFYMNTIDDKLPFTHIDENNESFYQFICNNLFIRRNALEGENSYNLEVRLSPTTRLPREPFKLIKDDTLVDDTMRVFTNSYDNYQYIDNGNLKVILEFMSAKGEKIFFVELYLNKFDEDFYYFSGNIKTNDYLSTTHMIQIIDGFKDAHTMSPEVVNPKLIPTTGTKIKAYILYETPDKTIPKKNIFTQFEGYETYTLTDSYYLDDTNLANFAIPVQEINSYVEYIFRQGPGKLGFRIESVPMVKANYMKLGNSRKEFFNNFVSMYTYIEDALSKLTNNFSIDLKFFNTYGYSQHYYLVGGDQHIDKVNISIRYAVRFTTSADKEEEKARLSQFIKSKIEEAKLSLTSSPSFYISALTTECTSNFPSIRFMDFRGINHYGPEIQSLESDVNESNIIQGMIETSDIIPEYLNVNFIINDGEKSPEVYIDLL